MGFIYKVKNAICFQLNLKEKPVRIKKLTGFNIRRSELIMSAVYQEI